jgi:hypothetical protein
MQLLEFPPPKEKAPRAKMPGASRSKLHNDHIDSALLTQGLDTVRIYSDAVQQHLFVRACLKYLGEEAKH